MQMVMDFGASGDLRAMQDLLRRSWGPLEPPPRRTPVQQLVKSLISNRTYDRVSLEAYERLTGATPDWDVMAAQPPSTIEAQISTVEFPERKARHLKATLCILSRESPGFDLQFLSMPPIEDALAWLERLPGVGRKVAASVLNFSTLQRPALVIDTHLKRVLHRLGFVAENAATEAMYDTMMQAAEGWTARELTDLHVWLKHLGQTCCRPARSACDDCPLAARCSSAGMPV